MSALSSAKDGARIARTATSELDEIHAIRRAIVRDFDARYRASSRTDE